MTPPPQLDSVAGADCAVTEVGSPPPSPESAPQASDAHTVLVDRKGGFSCPTLPPEALERLQHGFRSRPWYRDSWTCPAFRAALQQVRGQFAPGGLIVVGPRMGFDPPAPFDEFFEPVRLTLWDSGGDPQLRMLSGPTPTRQERAARIIRVVLAGLAALAVLGGMWSIFATGSTRPFAIIVGLVVGNALIVAVILWLMGLGGTWYVVPGGVAIVRPLARARKRLVLLTRHECDAMVRWVHTGKTTMLVVELCERTGRTWRQAVSERQALGVLAAWQSRHPVPSMEQLRQVLDAPS